MKKLNKKPNSARNLDMAIRRMVADKNNPDLAFVEYRDLLANVVVAQLIPECVIKGGSSLKIRYGINETRYTTDFDISYLEDLETFIETFQNNLADGIWGFTGRLIKKNPAHPKNIAFEYVMKPFEVKLDYYGKSWCTVIFETGKDEIGNTREFDECKSEEIDNFVSTLGFDTPKTFRLMTLPYQIAQKLHGLTAPNSLRIHDLIDLQLIIKNSYVDFEEVRHVCERLFKYRKQQPWPPDISINEKLRDLYIEKAKDINVIQDYDEAIEWLDSYIGVICHYPEPNEESLKAIKEAEELMRTGKGKFYSSAEELMKDILNEIEDDKNE